MTEDEAKTKWCPHVRFTSNDERMYDNRPSRHPDTACCIASDCMAWRWVNPHSEAPDGYCGLAGRP